MQFFDLTFVIFVSMLIVIISLCAFIYWYLKVPGGTLVRVRYQGGTERQFTAKEVDRKLVWMVGRERSHALAVTDPAVLHRWGKAYRIFYVRDGEDQTTNNLDPDAEPSAEEDINRYRRAIYNSMVVKDLASGLLTRWREVLMGAIMGGGVVGMLVLIWWMNNAGVIS